jgi:hypothetical protein
MIVISGYNGLKTKSFREEAVQRQFPTNCLRMCCNANTIRIKIREFTHKSNMHVSSHFVRVYST